MNCIIVDDEPLAREAIEILVKEIPYLELAGTFNNASSAAWFMDGHTVDLIFLDIQMPGITGMDFAKTISRSTLIIFTTAYSEYALDSYEVDAIDYLIKPVEPERFRKAVDKAFSYHSLLLQEEKENILLLCEIRPEVLQSKLQGYTFCRGIEGLCNLATGKTAHYHPDESKSDV